MSRVGRKPIVLPQGVDVSLDGRAIRVKGKLGELRRELPEGIQISIDSSQLVLIRSDDSNRQKALHGLSRALTANMVKGVNEGYSKNMEIVGVGYRCDLKGRGLILAVGFSHRVVFIPPEGINLKITTPTAFTVSGIDNQVVGDVAAKIRSIRPPEPYKGKGIKYADETIRRKAGKTAGK
jgi:large subunit ribosomal protein L6